MPRKIEVTLYQFDELPDKRAKERARDWYRQGALDHDWWDAVYDDARTCLWLAGFSIKDIFFSGFASQGDGAMFTGTWGVVDVQPVKAMRAHAPRDKELHRIAARLRDVARKDREAYTEISHRGHGCHEMTAVFETSAKTPELAETIKETSRDAMRWIYRQLEREHDWLLSDEQVDESIRANEYEFTADGHRA